MRNRRVRAGQRWSVGAGILALLALGCLCSCDRGAPTRPNVVLIVLDTVRADLLSCYGHPERTTPHIDSLCAAGLRFTNASSTSSWTVPAHASLFTGLYPIDHRATQENPRLRAGHPTHAEILSSVGYATYGVSGNPLVGRLTGLDRGFDRFVSTRERTGDTGPHPTVTAARKLLRADDGSRPFLLFVNFMDAHRPYRPPDRERRRFLAPEEESQAPAALSLRAEEFYLHPARARKDLEVLRKLYAAEIAALDRDVGDLLGVIEAEAGFDETLVILTSDHGESFGENGHIGHVFALTKTLVHIPLVLFGAGVHDRGATREDPVSLLDVFTTILERAGIPGDPNHPGIDLLAAPAAADRPVYAEYYYPLQALANLGSEALTAHPEVFDPFRQRLRSVERDGVRLVESTSGERRFYDLRGDPSGREPLAQPPGGIDEELMELLEEFVERGGGPRPLPAPASVERGGLGELDPETELRLRELGYVQ